jgi:hypothetical protein
MKLIFSLFAMFVAVAHAAGLEFAETSKEIDTAADAATVTTDFAFTNKSDKTVTITKSDGGCSCLKAQISDGKLKYAPGESGVVRATFEMGNFSGTVEKMIAIWLDGDRPEAPSVKLSLKFKIPVLVSLEPKTLQWTVGEKAESKTIKIQMAEGQTIHVTGVKSSSEAFTHELKKIKDGKEYELIVTPNGTADSRLAVFRIETDCAVSKHRVQQAFGVVKRPTSPATALKP